MDASVSVEGLKIVNLEDKGCIVQCELCHCYLQSMLTNPDRQRSKFKLIIFYIYMCVILYNCQIMNKK